MQWWSESITPTRVGLVVLTLSAIGGMTFWYTTGLVSTAAAVGSVLSYTLLVLVFVLLRRAVAARTRAEQAWQASEIRCRLLFESHPHPMSIYDTETLAFLAVNEAAVYQYGYTHEEFLAMTIKDVRPPEDIPALLANVARRTASFDAAGRGRHRKKDGTIIDVEVTSHTLTFAGRPARLVQAQDITARTRAEAAQRRYAERLQILLESAFPAALPEVVAPEHP